MRACVAETERSMRALIAVGFGAGRGRHLLFFTFGRPPDRSPLGPNLAVGMESISYHVCDRLLFTQEL